MRIREVISSGILLATLSAVTRGDDPVDYVQDIKPILSRHCYTCHGALKQQQELRLDTAALAIQGGESGAAIVPGDSGQSLIIAAVTGSDGATRMPAEGEPLSPEQIETLRRWIDQGAKAPVEPIPEDPAKHWAYQPPRKVPPPMVLDPDWSHNPIDAFIAAEHARHGLTPSDIATKHVLLRRVYIDLIGIPPTRADLKNFLADTSTNAYGKVVDRLLASPQYGERWGRHWMDVWRYSDWDGFGQEVRESKPHIWRWRDWIIESLNSDKGYDQMIVEMLAGDEVAPDDPNVLRATGFLARNWFSFNRNVWLDNTVEHTAKAFLATTVNCARCHDHMYDPIAQQEYYQFRAFFEAHDVRTDRVPGQFDTSKDGLVRVYDAKADTPTYLFQRGNDKQPDTDHPLTADLPTRLRPVDFRIEPVALSATSYYPALRRSYQDDLLSQSQQELEAARNALSAVAKPETKAGESATAVDEAQLGAAAKTAELHKVFLERSLATVLAKRLWVQARIPADRAAYAIPPASDAADLATTAVLAEQEYNLRTAEQNIAEAQWKIAAARQANNSQTASEAQTKLAAAVKARDEALEATREPPVKYSPLSEVYPTSSTGRRLALARSIADTRNPLTARVAINHIWLRHVASPLVSTVFDFGRNGKAPTHPELLDWLAVELMANGWRMKPIHKLIVTSQSYRQLSQSQQPSNQVIDPDNWFLWRANSRRMEAEAIRDATLAVSGRLDATQGGPELDENSGMTVFRRSVYFRNSKEKKMTFLDAFDRPNVVDCYRRTESVAPQQALAMANGSLALSESRVLAAKLSAEVGLENTPANMDEFIDTAFETVLCRPCTPDEKVECARFVDEQTRKYGDVTKLTKFTTGSSGSVPPAADPHQRARENLVHVILNHNDFLTIR